LEEYQYGSASRKARAGQEQREGGRKGEKVKQTNRVQLFRFFPSSTRDFGVRHTSLDEKEPNHNRRSDSAWKRRKGVRRREEGRRRRGRRREGKVEAHEVETVSWSCSTSSTSSSTSSERHIASWVGRMERGSKLRARWGWEKVVGGEGGVELEAHRFEVGVAARASLRIRSLSVFRPRPNRTVEGYL